MREAFETGDEVVCLGAQHWGTYLRPATSRSKIFAAAAWGRSCIILMAHWHSWQLSRTCTGRLREDLEVCCGGLGGAGGRSINGMNHLGSHLHDFQAAATHLTVCCGQVSIVVHPYAAHIFKHAGHLWAAGSEATAWSSKAARKFNRVDTDRCCTGYHMESLFNILNGSCGDMLITDLFPLVNGPRDGGISMKDPRHMLTNLSRTSDFGHYNHVAWILHADAAFSRSVEQRKEVCDQHVTTSAVQYVQKGLHVVPRAAPVDAHTVELLGGF
ncbi:hypothetical protein JKP88DRAFT_248783 [Tribonema minus]|uniref:Uncharacterized protein n=1 Tax=Tribonema minus TaxID=303371 RepID=A0A835YLI7_9STRA|nr:hypothetical protein JKP88DRAFT_248783 [Tribonema minus]